MLIILVPFFSITGMITDRNLLSKFPVCYELVFFSIAVNTLLRLCSDFESIIILLVLFNSVFEALLGLSILVLIISLRFTSLPLGILSSSLNILCSRFLNIP